MGGESNVEGEKGRGGVWGDLAKMVMFDISGGKPQQSQPPLGPPLPLRWLGA